MRRFLPSFPLLVKKYASKGRTAPPRFPKAGAHHKSTNNIVYY
jgi:hypothetical protein